MRRLAAAVLGSLMAVAALAMAGQSPADAPPAAAAEVPQDLRQRFEALLADLDGATYARREAAEQEALALVLAQPQLKPLLEQAAAADPRPEVRTRAARSLEKLEEHQLFGQTRVTLQVSEVHPRLLIAELGRQAGISFELVPEDPWQQAGSQRRISMELVDEPFWEALRRVSQETGLTPVEHQHTPGGVMVLTPHGAAPAQAPESSHGAFTVQLRRMQMTQHAMVDLIERRDGRIDANAVTNRSMVLDLRLLVEPKVRLTGGLVQPIIEEARDDRGHDLLANRSPQAGRTWAVANSSWSIQSQVQLNAEQMRGSGAIATLRGRFELEVAREVKQVRIPLSELADLSRMRDGTEVAVRRVESAGPQQLELLKISRQGEQMMQVEFILRSEGVDMNDPGGWARLQALAAMLVLEDADGRRWMTANDNAQWSDQGGIKVTRQFHGGRAGTGPAAQLVWEAPLRIQTVPVPFEFNDVPLPGLD